MVALTICTFFLFFNNFGEENNTTEPLIKNPTLQSSVSIPPTTTSFVEEENEVGSGNTPNLNDIQDPNSIEPDQEIFEKDLDEIIDLAIEENSQVDIYIVVPGDFLWAIAQRTGTTIDVLVALNGIANTSLIEVGQKIYLPSSTTNTLALDNKCTREQKDCWEELVRSWAIYYRASPTLATCIVRHESQFSPYAKNPHSTAGGLWQFIDSTWLSTVERMGLSWDLTDKFDGHKNAQAGAWLLANDGYTHWVVWPYCV